MAWIGCQESKREYSGVAVLQIQVKGLCFYTNVSINSETPYVLYVQDCINVRVFSCDQSVEVAE